MTTFMEGEAVYGTGTYRCSFEDDEEPLDGLFEKDLLTPANAPMRRFDNAIHAQYDHTVPIVHTSARLFPLATWHLGFTSNDSRGMNGLP